ncbi:MAG: redoxin domain-containing protein [Bdellovibrionales bacterium]|nr:redoxin domain-containing protein [Bdellovibrionales bacterium]
MNFWFKIHKVVQRYFPIPAYLTLLGLTILSFYRLALGPALEWSGPVLVTYPFCVLTLRIQIFKDTLRTERGSYLAFAGAGSLFAVVYSWGFSTGFSEAVQVALLGAFIAIFDTFAYNFLQAKSEESVLAPGKVFPDFMLKDATGRVVKTYDLMPGPALVLFIRGNWCPLCMAQVKEVAGAYRELDDRAVSVLIISSQRQEMSEQLAASHKVPFKFLVDEDLKLASALKLVHKNGVPIGLSRSKYGSDTIFPTAIITNEKREVIYIDQTDDVTIRPEPETFLAVLDEYKVNHQLEQKVQARTRDVRDLLDNIGEGFFSFGMDYSIHKERSKACDEFFGEEIKYKDPFALVRAKDIQGVKSTLEMVFLGQCDFSMIEELLPKDVTLGEGPLGQGSKIYSLKYRFVTNAENLKESRVIVIVRDVTKERILAAQFAAEEELNNMIVRVAIDRDGFIQLLGDSQKMIRQIQEVLQRDPAKIDVNELFRLLHTIKGGMGIFGLKKVASAAHTLEGELAQVRSGKQVLTDSVRIALQEGMMTLEHRLDEQLGQLSKIVPREDLSNDAEPVFKVSSSQINALSQDLLAKIPKEAWDEVRTRIDALRKQPLKKALKRLVSLAEDLAPKLDKFVKIEVEGDEVPVLHEKLESVFGSLVHLVRNSLDHGLETPDARVAAGKPEEGTLRFEASTRGRELKLIIRDDGGGVRVAAVKKVALAKQLASQEELEKMEPAKVVELIFSPGFSTKTEVTDVSGRGVGMNAVKAAVEQAHGKIQIQTEEGKGTTFEITLPDVA